MCDYDYEDDDYSEGEAFADYLNSLSEGEREELINDRIATQERMEEFSNGDFW